MKSLKRPLQFAATLVALSLMPQFAQAQKLVSMTVEPSTIEQSGSVKATVNFEVLSGTNCGIRLHWGDGVADNVKINQKKDAPWIAEHKYANAGTYEVMAEPKTQGMTPRCGGDNQRVKVVVKAPAPAPAAAVPKATVAGPAAAVNPCPDGWKLSKAGVSKSNKSFTCTAAANTKLPAQRLECPGDLSYFENAKKGQLGCKL